MLESLPFFSNEVGQISRWIQSLGIIALIVVIYSLTMFFINRKQAKDLNKIKRDLDEINGKLDKLISRGKK